MRDLPCLLFLRFLNHVTKTCKYIDFLKHMPHPYIFVSYPNLEVLECNHYFYHSDAANDCIYIYLFLVLKKNKHSRNKETAKNWKLKELIVL